MLTSFDQLFSNMENTSSSQKGGVFTTDPNRGRKLAAALLENVVQLDKNNMEKFENLQVRSGAPGTQALRDATSALSKEKGKYGI
jgi:hypothetical protein